MKIPWWINLLARLHPFSFCEICITKSMNRQLKYKVTRFEIVMRWAQGRCMTCGRHRGMGETIVCALCHEEEATNTITVKTSNGVTFPVVLCDICLDDIDV